MEIEFPLTSDQREAVEALGRSVLVSAAAGSGKTRVLAERCAHLVCDLPGEKRCNISDLLVVTFTEAAAAEMRRRIRKEIRRRADTHPTDAHVRQQLLLLDEAHICTLHSFCLWLLRQHFMRCRLDPSAGILDEDEAGLLLESCLEQVFAARQLAGGEVTATFRRLLSYYAGGREETLSRYVVKLYQFLRTLHNRGDWLRAAREALSLDVDAIRDSERVLLVQELQRQIAATAAALEFIQNRLVRFGAYAEYLRKHLERLREWEVTSLEPARFDACIQAIRDHDMRRLPAIRFSKDATADNKRDKEFAKDEIGRIKKYFDKRLQSRFALFTPQERYQDHLQVTPHVTTLLALVAELEDAYSGAKRRRHALDFDDFEQYAYGLLSAPDGEPSDVAKSLHNRFHYVLIDEYQDINPIQNEILRLVSRECDPARYNNLFAVGDIKQSIYGFRLADPGIFLERIARHDQDHVCIPLSRNFRSVGHITCAVNNIFECLMTRAVGDIDYDSRQALVPNREDGCDRPAVEFHLLAEIGQAVADEAEQDEFDDPSDLQCQARFIARHILASVKEGRQAFGDHVVLLRAAASRADLVADTLHERGVPAMGDARTGFLGATEVNDVLALLAIVDNMYQDIPLAAVMRSGVAGLRFSESELLRIRHTDRTVPFHQCVLRPPAADFDEPLAAKLREFVKYMQQLKERFGREPLPLVLWSALQEGGYLSYVLGLLNGANRHANLVMLHQRAEQFARFSGQHGLFEFLRFIECLRRSGRDLGVGLPNNDVQDVVRVMTIHASKGLEFPVVYLINLEKRFNQRDSQGLVVVDRHEHIGLQVMDAGRRIRYPSLSYERVKQRVKRQTLAEELRILYVAMTRAEDRLIMVGSADLDRVRRRRQMWQDHRGPLSELTLLGGSSYLDWLEPAVSRMGADIACWVDDGGEPAPTAAIMIDLHEPDVADDSEETKSPDDQRPLPCARLEPLPAGEALAKAPAVDALFKRIEFDYPHQAMCAIPSVMTVTDIKRRLEPVDELAPRPVGMTRRVPRPQFRGMDISAAEIGSATHLLLQNLDYGRSSSVAEQLRGLVEQGWLRQELADAINVDDINWFLNTPLGHTVIGLAGSLLREVPFIARMPAGELDAQVHPASSKDFILQRGMIDLIVPVGDGFEIIDFKTDRLEPQELTSRVAIYADQIRRYAMAVEDIWRRPVATGHLVFLGLRQIQQVISPRHAATS